MDDASSRHDQTDNVYWEAHAQISVIKDNIVINVDAVDGAVLTSLEDGVVGSSQSYGELYCKLYCVYSTTV